MQTEKISPSDRLPIEPSPHFADLESRINHAFTDTLKKIFESRLELDTKTTSRLIGSQVRPPEEVKAELHSLQQSLTKLMAWAETTQKQIARTLDPAPPKPIEPPPPVPQPPVSWLRRMLRNLLSS